MHTCAVRTCRCTPPYTFVKHLANWSRTTPNFSAICPAFSEIRKMTHLQVRTCARADIPTPPMTCVIHIATWCLNTHQIWSQLAEPFLSYSLAAKFDTIHAVRGTCQGDPKYDPNPAVIWAAHTQIFPINHGRTRFAR